MWFYHVPITNFKNEPQMYTASLCQRINLFHSRYLLHHGMGICYQKGLFGRKYIDQIYIYTKDGEVYKEFFSGQIIGKKSYLDHGYNGKDVLISPDVFHSLYLTRYDNDLPRIDSLSQAQLAAKVKPYMDSKDLLAQIMNEFCDINRACRSEERMKREKEYVTKQAHDNQNINWLNSFLNGNK